MHFQFLIEDHSTTILVGHVMKKMQDLYPTEYITFDMKSFGGIGGLKKTGTPINQKTDKLLNSLPHYLRAFDRSLVGLEQSVIVVVLDNDKHDPVQFRRKLENLAKENMLQKKPIFGIAIKEMEAWLLGDVEAIKAAYPHARINAMRSYEQDGICETWEVLANAVYPKGLKELRKKAGSGYAEIGKAKAEWADLIGKEIDLRRNVSPSFKRFIIELEDCMPS